MTEEVLVKVKTSALLEGWLSGRKHLTANEANRELFRRFESYPFRNRAFVARVLKVNLMCYWMGISSIWQSGRFFFWLSVRVRCLQLSKTHGKNACCSWNLGIRQHVIIKRMRWNKVVNKPRT